MTCKKKNTFFILALYLFLVPFLRAEFRYDTKGRGVVCTSNMGHAVNAITYRLLAFSKAHCFSCIKRDLCSPRVVVE